MRKSPSSPQHKVQSTAVRFHHRRGQAFPTCSRDKDRHTYASKNHESTHMTAHICEKPHEPAAPKSAQCGSQSAAPKRESHTTRCACTALSLARNITKSALGDQQSAAPATKSWAHKVLWHKICHELSTKSWRCQNQAFATLLETSHMSKVHCLHCTATPPKTQQVQSDAPEIALATKTEGKTASTVHGTTTRGERKVEAPVCPAQPVGLSLRSRNAMNVL